MTQRASLAVAHCVHHKPWLIGSTLVSTHAQNFNDFHTFFLVNQGLQRDLSEGKYKERFAEYQSLVQRHRRESNHQSETKVIEAVNIQLDKYDNSVERFCDLGEHNSTRIDYENDHGLDSGAWLKFIRSGLWRAYDYTLFLGEGGLLARDSCLMDLIRAMGELGIHFITGGQDKRFVPRRRWEAGFASEKKANTDMSLFHDQMIKETYSRFRADPEFDEIYMSWPKDEMSLSDNMVPKVWGPRHSLLRLISQGLVYDFANSLIPRAEDKSFSFLRNQIQVTPDMKERHRVGSTNFYLENHIGWYGACCNHMMSRSFLERLSAKLEHYEIYDLLDLPYCATALEQIWGLIPYWLGENLWFTDGIHRVRKNFFTYRREDELPEMVRYLNRYFASQLQAYGKENTIRIKIRPGLEHDLSGLPEFFQHV